MCGQVVCVSKLCVSLCVVKLCVRNKLCVGGSGGRVSWRTAGAGGSAQPKTSPPHKDVGNKVYEKAWISKTHVV